MWNSLLEFICFGCVPLDAYSFYIKLVCVRERGGSGKACKMRMIHSSYQALSQHDMVVPQTPQINIYLPVPQTRAERWQVWLCPGCRTLEARPARALCERPMLRFAVASPR